MRRTRVMATLERTKGDVVVRRHHPDYQIVLFMGLLMLLGLIVMYAIGPQRANLLNGGTPDGPYSSTYFFMKQGLSLIIALVGFTAMAMIPLDILRRHAKHLLYIAFGACLLLFVAGNIFHAHAIAQCTLGACRWFYLGPLGSFQPAELLKFAIMIFLSGFLARRIQQGLINDLNKTLIPVAALYLLAMMFVVVLERDMGTGITLTCIVASIFVIGGVSRRITLWAVGGLLVLGLLLIVIAPHRMSRITTFIAGDGTSGQITNENYQVANAKIALGSGGVFGRGIGNSVQASGYLPEAINDSVFAIIGEIFGFIGVVIVIGLFTLLLMRLLRIGNHMPNVWMQLMVGGVFGWLASHVIINIAAMIGVFPLTGITLPMLSFGGTSMIFIALSLGIAFQLSRYTTHGDSNNNERLAYESLGSRRGVRRTRYASRRSTQTARNSTN